MLGNLRETALATGVGYETLKLWKLQNWWKDLVLEIRDEDVGKLGANLQKIIEKSLRTVEDRLDKGEFQYDPKTGKAIRIPIKANIALKVTTELMTKQEKLRAEPVKLEIEKTIDARLAKLADEFSRFSKATDVTPEAMDRLKAEVVVKPQPPPQPTPQPTPQQPQPPFSFSLGDSGFIASS